MEVAKAREILGETAEKMSDEGIQESIYVLEQFVDAALDKYFSMTPEEIDNFFKERGIET
ncbi:MAG: hypothetical protein LBG64_00580 [Pseudomonadales bacterium]|jgi:hypothetical protein|nr:hypothetical protein [Pseudomonadales bacterium]